MKYFFMLQEIKCSDHKITGVIWVYLHIIGSKTKRQRKFAS